MFTKFNGNIKFTEDLPIVYILDLPDISTTDTPDLIYEYNIPNYRELERKGYKFFIFCGDLKDDSAQNLTYLEYGEETAVFSTYGGGTLSAPLIQVLDNDPQIKFSISKSSDIELPSRIYLIAFKANIIK